MKILLTGANGYIGMRLLPQLVDMGHEVICTVRDAERFAIDDELRSRIAVVEIDFLDKIVEDKVPRDIDVAYFLIPKQITSIEKYCGIIHSSLKIIETCGGGSARCMMAEVFLPKA